MIEDESMSCCLINSFSAVCYTYINSFTDQLTRCAIKKNKQPSVFEIHSNADQCIPYQLLSPAPFSSQSPCPSVDLSHGMLSFTNCSCVGPPLAAVISGNVHLLWLVVVPGLRGDLCFCAWNTVSPAALLFVLTGLFLPIFSASISLPPDARPEAPLGVATQYSLM